MGALWLWVKYPQHPNPPAICDENATTMVPFSILKTAGNGECQWLFQRLFHQNPSNSRKPSPCLMLNSQQSQWLPFHQNPENRHHVWCWTPNNPINPKITMGNCINPTEKSHRMGLCHKVYLPSGSMEIWRFLARRMAAPTFRTAGQLGSWAWHF